MSEKADQVEQCYREYTPPQIRELQRKMRKKRLDRSRRRRVRSR